jgi:hypothetical protein
MIKEKAKNKTNEKTKASFSIFSCCTPALFEHESQDPIPLPAFRRAARLKGCLSACSTTNTLNRFSSVLILT